MAKLITLVMVGLLLFLLACSGEPEFAESRDSADELSVTSQSKSAAVEEAGVFAASAALSFAMGDTEDGRVALGMALQTLERKVISSATVSIKVKVVEEAVAQIRTIADGVGGFVEQLSSSGSAKRQQASMTVRVPEDQFFTALERIETLGEVQSKNVGSEDVSEQFIDLEARLRSTLREEESMLALLGRSVTVSEVLAIERELARVRSEIERLQGQLNFLERRVALATISVFLSPPQVQLALPPSGSLSMEVADVTGSLEEAKARVVSLDGLVEEVFLSVLDGKERAELVLRVRTADFNRMMAFLESQGKVKLKEVREGTVQDEIEGDTSQPSGGAGDEEEPEARIELSLLEEEGSLSLALIFGITGAIGAVVLLVLLALIFYITAKSTRRRRRNF